MKLEKYSLLMAIKPQLSERKFRELCRQIEFKERMRELEKIRKQLAGEDNETITK
jgi:hypothetical protein